MQQNWRRETERIKNVQRRGGEGPDSLATEIIDLEVHDVSPYC